MLVGSESSCQKKKPSSDRRHDSQQRERERGGREEEGDKRQKERKAAEIKRGRQRETTGTEMPVRKTNEDADLRQDDNTLPGWTDWIS